MKNKISILTQQDLLGSLSERIRYFFIRSYASYNTTVERKQHAAAIANRLDALPRPLVVEDVKKILRESNLSEGWWKSDFLPTCDICGKEWEWILVIHDAFQEDEGNDRNLHLCAKCVDIVKTKVDMEEIRQKTSRTQTTTEIIQRSSTNIMTK